MQKRVILFNIRSAHNVGSIFRSADGVGAEKIYLVGPTPLPVDRFGRVQSEIKKTSLGASETVPWEHVGEVDSESLEAALTLVTRLKNEGFTVMAVEQVANSVSLYDFTPPNRVAYIFGHEVDGVPCELLKAADGVVEIPMAGKKESLNVSVAAGIVLFRR